MALPVRRRSSGFTLLELCVVLTIIALLAGLILPRLGVLGGVALDASARRLATRIRYLREDAALRRRWIRLAFDPTEGSYSPAVLVQTEGGTRFVDDPEPLYRRVELPESLELRVTGVNLATTAEGLPATVFSPDGFADPLAVTLRDRSGRELTIAVVPTLASPRIVAEGAPGAVQGSRLRTTR